MKYFSCRIWVFKKIVREKYRKKIVKKDTKIVTFDDFVTEKLSKKS